MRGLVSVDGTVTPPEAACVPALDRGLLYGDAVLETLVAFRGPGGVHRLLEAPRHLARLRESAEALGFEVPWSDAELEFELAGLVEAVNVPKAYVRLTVSRGSGLALKPPADLKPRRIVYCLPATEEPPSTYSEGLALRRLLHAPQPRGAQPKTTHYLPAVTALNRARQEGYDEILWTNADGEITEASTANIFLMARQGDQVELVTPPVQSGLMPGITRETVVALLRRAGLPVREQTVFADELPRFDEAFLTSSVRGLVPVSRIDRHKLHSARDGAVFRHIERLFLTWVETEVGHRVDWATGRPVATPTRGG